MDQFQMIIQNLLIKIIGCRNYQFGWEPRGMSLSPYDNKIYLTNCDEAAISLEQLISEKIMMKNLGWGGTNYSGTKLVQMEVWIY